MNKLARGWLLVWWLSGCSTGVSGTWTGVMDSPDKIGVRFVLEEKEGRLGGRVFYEDPETRQFDPESEISGTVVDGTASWTTETDVQISGKFDGNSFTGTIVFPPDGDERSHSARLTLAR